MKAAMIPISPPVDNPWPRIEMLQTGKRSINYTKMCYSRGRYGLFVRKMDQPNAAKFAIVLRLQRTVKAKEKTYIQIN